MHLWFRPSALPVHDVLRFRLIAILTLVLTLQGTGKRASTALESELEAIGARMKSYTSRDRTAVYVHSSAQDVEKGGVFQIFTLQLQL